MIRKYLITYFKSFKLKKKSHIIFENEYLQKSFKNDELKKYKCSSIENLSQVYNKKNNYSFCKKKAQRYLSEIFPSLNQLNHIQLKRKEWEMLIEYFLIISLMNIKRRLDTLKKIKNKKNIYIQAENYNFFFENTNIFRKFQFEDINFNFYINFLISKRLSFKRLGSKKVRKIFAFEKFKRKTLLKKIVYFFYNNFLFFLKPIIILDGYFGIKNSLKILIKSKFKILFANIDYF